MEKESAEDASGRERVRQSEGERARERESVSEMQCERVHFFDLHHH